jgi:hypothetical protein
MKYYKVSLFCCFFLFLALACADKEQDRISALHEMPVLWESEVLIPDPDNPDLKVLIALNDRYDPNFVEFMSDTAPKTEDYIPDAVRAFSIPEFDNSPREVTLRLGDMVGVLKAGSNNSKVPIFLVRTQHGTYAWIYAYHVQGKDGERLARLK